jgi:hypothetical protein
LGGLCPNCHMRMALLAPTEKTVLPSEKKQESRTGELCLWFHVFLVFRVLISQARVSFDDLRLAMNEKILLTLSLGQSVDLLSALLDLPTLHASIPIH